MRIVFLTNEGFDERFRCIYANVAACFPDVHVVAVRRAQAQKKPFSLLGLGQNVRRLLWRAQRFGGVHAWEVLTSYPLRRFIIQRYHWSEVNERSRSLPRPSVKFEPEKAVYVEAVNSPEMVEVLSKLEPDVVVQSGAGILRREVFEVARIGTLNLHPGIAPLIRGAEPVYWALWEEKHEWLGATVHYIDEGIDTGPVLAYAPVEPLYPGERPAPIDERITKVGVESLVDALCRLSRGERWTIPPPQGERVYRTIFSGWRLLLLEIRLAFRRRRAGRHS